MNYEDRKKEYMQEAEKLFDDLYVPKNRDYGDSFERLLERLGPTSFVTRAADKMERLISITEKGKIEVGDETVEDTIKDLANYCLMYLRWAHRHTNIGNMPKEEFEDLVEQVRAPVEDRKTPRELMRKQFQHNVFCTKCGKAGRVMYKMAAVDGLQCEMCYEGRTNRGNEVTLCE